MATELSSGIIAFSKSVGREAARSSIHVNCVCPDWRASMRASAPPISHGCWARSGRGRLAFAGLDVFAASKEAEEGHRAFAEKSEPDFSKFR